MINCEGELITPYQSAHSLRSSSQSSLCISGFDDNTNEKRFGAKCFKIAAPKLWNNLPDSVWKVKSFRRRLKIHLFSKSGLSLSLSLSGKGHQHVLKIMGAIQMDINIDINTASYQSTVQIQCFNINL